MYKLEQVSVSPDEVRSQLAGRLRRLIDQEVDADGWLDELTEALVLLESLPLSTSEYGLAASRLNNARRYLESSERGAARYELRLVAGSLNGKRDEAPL